MKYLTKHIFLDTNIYEENNFFQSSNIQSLFYYAKIKVINLYMTEISKRELIERMRKRLVDVKENHNKLIKLINKTRILKNLPIYENIDKSILTVDESITELIRKLGRIIESSNITIIPSDGINIDEVFNLYYNHKPPFSKKENKKYEFPDAFIIKTIDFWCKKNKKKIIFLTKDQDYIGYKSRRILFRQNLSDLLEEITKYYASLKSDQLIPHIQKSLDQNKNNLLYLIDSELGKYIKINIDFENIANFERSEIKFHSYKITSIRPDYAEITYFISFNIRYTILPNPIDFGSLIFDENIRPKKISEDIVIPCDLEMYFHQKNDIKLKWINSNQKILIQNEKNYSQ